VPKPQSADSQIQSYLNGKSLSEAKQVEAFSAVEYFKQQSRSLGSEFAQFRQANQRRAGGKRQAVMGQGGVAHNVA
jgi:hypothetical protein